MPSPTAETGQLNASDAAFLNDVKQAFEQSGTEFARTYYLFATARLSETFNSEEIHQRYPILCERETVTRLQGLLEKESGKLSIESDTELKRLFVSALKGYLDAETAADSDKLENARNDLKVSVSGLGLKDTDGKVVDEILYQDVAGWLKKLEDKSVREELYSRMRVASNEALNPLFLDLFHRENRLMAELGYPDVVDFHGWATNHDFNRLGEQAERLLRETKDSYRKRMGEAYHQRTGLNFETDATRPDISYVLHGPSNEMASVNARLSCEQLVPLAKQTFDRLGLCFSELSQEVDFKDMPSYEQEIVQKTEAAKNAKTPLRRILLDIANRPGKPSRAYVYPAAVPSEVYLSVRPEGGLDDYLAFFHESGHAQHFAYESPDCGFAQNLLGNNTVTESYAYLFQNLFLNRHWLEHQAGLSKEEARQVVSRRALEDLYMLRRYASKMRFELGLFAGVNDPGYKLDTQGERYATLLTEGCGFRYTTDWTRDVDARFYVADYFTAWTLEAQFRQALCSRFGSDAVEEKEDWYLNPAAGDFLKQLWADGNLGQKDLCQRLGYDHPNDVTPLLHYMARNL